METADRTVARVALGIGTLLLVAGIFINPYAAACSVLPLGIGAWLCWAGRS